MSEKYDHKSIEKKWQSAWEEAGIYHARDTSLRPKKYILDMFPYPSGDGLHVGHVENYTATCIYARYMRMKGFNVLHPIGWDAFGLPAENYAIKTNVHPDESTHKNIKTFSAQIKALGISYDWTREIDTSSPEYYRWTQWFFLLLYKNGLAYKKKAKVNWCDSCKTVLANEQAEGGVCDRCKNMVIQKDLEQWFFKITDFAEDLIADLDTVDWPSSTIVQQRNWIGKSEGVDFEMHLPVANESVRVYTTRIDTVFGMTYVVLAPEHPLVAKLVSFTSNAAEVEQYVEATRRKTELERTELAKEKSGVFLRGVEAINPFTQKSVPVLIGDYVLGNYGTGAVMAVPAHDERDREFADKFDLPVLQVVEGGNSKDTASVTLKSGASDIFVGDGVLVNSGDFTGLTSGEAREKMASWLAREKIGFKKINYRLRDWLVSRQRYWGSPIPIIYCASCGEVPVPEKDLPVLLPTDVDFRPTGESPLAISESFHNVSCPKCGAKAKRESDTMDTFVCSSWYYLRFADPKNITEFADRSAINKWLPVDLYMGGAEHTVLHLLYARFFTKVLHSLGMVSFKEPFAKLRHQGMILGADGRKMSKSLGNVENPNKYIESDGADALRLYEMFMGPIADMKPWNPQGVVGPRRFLERVWRLRGKLSEKGDESAIETALHKTIKKVGEDIEEFSFNTAISSLMILLNDFEKMEQVPQKTYESFLILLAPFAPHITEELWHEIGNTESIHSAVWPTYDAAKCVANEITIVVQVNGKLRDTVVVPAGLGEEEIKELALSRPDIMRWTKGRNIVKTVFVKGRLLNIVVGDEGL